MMRTDHTIPGYRPDAEDRLNTFIGAYIRTTDGRRGVVRNAWWSFSKEYIVLTVEEDGTAETPGRWFQVTNERATIISVRG